MAFRRTPEPSKRFHSIKLPISEIDREWYRSHPTRRDAVYFGRKGAYRFDAPDGEYGVLYAGADARVSQRWSRAIQTHPEQPDGILYRPRHDPARLAAAFFDRIAGQR